MSLLKNLWRRVAPNPLTRLLQRAQGSRSVLLCWNRGLGDIPLGLYALTERIHESLPDASITVLTRPDLAQGFELLKRVTIRTDPTWKRGESISVEDASFDLILRHPDPTWWCRSQIGRLTPKLHWQPQWDRLCARFGLEAPAVYIGVHVETQTHYGYEKNWPLEYWKELFKVLPAGTRVLLFGQASQERFEGDNLIDLRGKTTLLEMLSIIKHHCEALLVPDSGILSMVYYLDVHFPLKVVSLWADPHQGVLKQNVASPNSGLTHIPLIAPNRDLRNVKVSQVLPLLI